MKRVWTVLIWMGVAAAAVAQDDELERLRKAAQEEKRKEMEGLPARVSRLEQELQKQKSSGAQLKDGLKFKSDDGNLEAHVGGRFLEHFRWVPDRPDSTRTSPDTFFVRQARLEMSGTFYKDYEFKVQADFPTGSSSTSGTLQDAFLGWKKIPELSVRIGQFKEPFSQEETTTTRFIDFVERSNVNRLVPARDIGLGIYGRLFEGRFEYEAGVFNGQGRAALDGNDEKDLALRLRVNPFVTGDLKPLKGLRIGIAATGGDVDSASINGLDFTTTELAVNFLDSTTGSIDGRRTRLGAELSWLHGPFGVRAEWLRRTDEVDIGALQDEEIDMTGWYVAVSWIVSGEAKPLENRIVPDKPLDLDAGTFGALELVARIANLSIDEDVLDLGIAPPGNTNEVTSITVGANWYLARNFRVSPNVVFEHYDDDVTFSADRAEDRLWGVLVRFQIDF